MRDQPASHRYVVAASLAWLLLASQSAPLRAEEPAGGRAEGRRQGSSKEGAGRRCSAHAAVHAHRSYATPGRSGPVPAPVPPTSQTRTRRNRAQPPIALTSPRSRIRSSEVLWALHVWHDPDYELLSGDESVQQVRWTLFPKPPQERKHARAAHAGARPPARTRTRLDCRRVVGVELRAVAAAAARRAPGRPSSCAPGSIGQRRRHLWLTRTHFRESSPHRRRSFCAAPTRPREEHRLDRSASLPLDSAAVRRRWASLRTHVATRRRRAAARRRRPAGLLRRWASPRTRSAGLLRRWASLRTRWAVHRRRLAGLLRDCEGLLRRLDGPMYRRLGVTNG
jgi:hypothetical protein